jgi:hypothetical protein
MEYGIERMDRSKAGVVGAEVGASKSGRSGEKRRKTDEICQPSTK